jgi:hypothetical protein
MHRQEIRKEDEDAFITSLSNVWRFPFRRQNTGADPRTQINWAQAAITVLSAVGTVVSDIPLEASTSMQVRGDDEDQDMPEDVDDVLSDVNSERPTSSRHSNTDQRHYSDKDEMIVDDPNLTVKIDENTDAVKQISTSGTPLLAVDLFADNRGIVLVPDTQPVTLTQGLPASTGDVVLAPATQPDTQPGKCSGRYSRVSGAFVTS